MILVTTAGKVGAEAARLIAARGERVRLVSRAPDRLEALTAAGVEVVEGDLGDRSAVEKAVAGVDAIVLVSPAVPDLELAVIEAAARAGVGHVVKITSKASADSPIPRRRDQARIEESLRASGLGHTLLRNNAYMQNFLMLAPGIRSARRFGASVGEGRVAMVDARDVAATAVSVALDPAPHDAATYWPSGPASLSYDDAAAIIGDVVGDAITYDRLSEAEQAAAMVAAGLPEPVARMNAQALRLFAGGDGDWVSDDVRRVSGHEPRSFRTFVEDHRDHFA